MMIIIVSDPASVLKGLRREDQGGNCGSANVRKKKS